MRLRAALFLAVVGLGGVLPIRSGEAATGGDVAADPGSMTSADSLGPEQRRVLLLARPAADDSLHGGLSPAVRFTYPHIPLGEVRGPIQLNTFKRTVYGADRGANAGLLLGTLGSVIGWWDEDTAWYLMGAGAALGAVEGAIRGDPD